MIKFEWPNIHFGNKSFNIETPLCYLCIFLIVSLLLTSTNVVADQPMCILYDEDIVMKYTEVDSTMIDSSLMFNIPDANIIEPDNDMVDVSDIEASRRVTAAKDQKYNSMGLPVDREWLTSEERAMKHIPFNDTKTKARFRAWRKIHNEEFLKYVEHVAKAEAKQFPLLNWQVIAAQAVLESGYGLSKLAIEGNNLFGHKCWGCNASKGEALILFDDNPDDHFRVMGSMWFSFRSHSKLMMGMYAKRVKNNSIDEWLDALCGCQETKCSEEFVRRRNKVYASSCYNGSNYTKKIRSLIKKHFADEG